MACILTGTAYHTIAMNDALHPIPPDPELTRLLPTDDAVGQVIPVIEEQVTIDKALVETGRVRVVKTVQERTETVDVPLTSEAYDVERVAVNQYVATPPPAVRYEGDTMIIPVLQEVVVVEKKTLLVEEVRITKRLTTSTETQSVTLRREDVSVEREQPAASATDMQNNPNS